MGVRTLIVLGIALVCFLVLIRVLLFKTGLIYVVKKWWRWIEDCFHVHQFLKVPEFNESMQENQLYRRVSLYLNSLSSLEDSDFTNLVTGKKPNDIVLCLDPNQTVEDNFLDAVLTWTNADKTLRNNCRSFLLKVRKADKRRILRPYLQHIHSVADEIELRKQRDLKLYMNIKRGEDDDDHHHHHHRTGGGDGRWRSAPFTHPSTFDTIAMEDDLKNKTTSKSIIVMEDLDRFLTEKSTGVSLSGVLNFMDGILNSCCAEERVMVFTMMNSKDRVDPSLLRPGRIDVHIHFPLCDFLVFKTLASSYLGLKDHKLFPQVEEIFQTGASLSPAEIGELMIANRNSPSRAIKSVMTALQTDSERRIAQRLGNTDGPRKSVEEAGASFRSEGGHAVREFRKLYGFLRMKSCKVSHSQSFDEGSVHKEG
ncbi:AAA-ATPase At2g46620-like isoform X2 [Juglans microcarpa x Juglans regia]|uniref:AAA-ATPase At2g46620-like isoform X2 n=1 Tax=Juglans microcarpa x Juglans regia TaxID=2249226 RepID=UPI001B7E9762|nr:AAA-ATPase At2g46620-like isoform X2 [Juglans microcarpa x Juglans regia]